MIPTLTTYIRSYRFRLAWSLCALLLIISFSTRTILFLYSLHNLDITVRNVSGIFLLGLFFDLLTAGYFIVPVALYLWVIPEKIFQKQFHRFLLNLFFFIAAYLLIFNAFAEFFFWDEFNTRFNFIAVDYLVYTTEVIGNIRESYPVGIIITGIIVVDVALTFLFHRHSARPSYFPLSFRQRTYGAVVVLSLPVLSFFLFGSSLHQFSTNAYANELAGNGIYDLFAAYRNNELDYERFYPTIDESTAFGNVRRHFGSSAKPTNNDPSGLAHIVTSNEPEKHLNVVLISVESLSASFMSLFGNEDHITPFLDSLSGHSLVFTNLYATGTRTVRGLEALSLSVPPTPGQSIVRRPNNEHLFTLGSVFLSKGYVCKYIYGGYGYFDNMNYFFDQNGYEVIDRMALEDTEIDYENIWGVADENLFTLGIREIDKSVAQGKPVFAHIMTTSNHRPFTYPEGRIDIPSQTGRNGAVKYTDYSIRKFLLEARKKEWFDNTVFVITADHCASSAGKTELPLKKYQIPLLIYSPLYIDHQVENRLMSQIDIAPTLLGLLNFSYLSKFYGYDILKTKKGEERAFISTYQALGFIERDSMVVLSPGNKPKVFVIGKDKESTTRLDNADDHLAIVTDAISWYQTASYSFKKGLMKNNAENAPGK